MRMHPRVTHHFEARFSHQHHLPDVRPDDCPLWYEVPAVDVVTRHAVREPERDRGVPPQDLEDERAHVRQPRTVRKCGKARPLLLAGGGRAEKRVELCLRARLDGGVERHREDEGGH